MIVARRASNTGQKRIKRNLEAIMPLTKQFFSLLKYYVIGVAIILTVTSYIAKPVVVRGTSMNPTLNDFDICISNRLSIVLGGSVDRFDIVVAQSEEGEIVKRVVGIPGDTISYKDGVLTVNGTTIVEDYIIDDPIKHHSDMDVYEEKLGPLQLKRAKAQMVGQLAISSENYENLMLSIGKSFLIYDKVDSLEDIYTQIEEITPELLIRVAKEVFDVEKQSVLLYK